MRHIALVLFLGWGFTIIMDPTPATATVINAVSCTSTAIQNAITSTVDGDTVQIPSCSHTAWTAQVEIPNTKGITLQGTGTATTIIDVGGIDGTPSGALEVKVAPGHSVTRVTAMTLDDQGLSRVGAGAAIVVWGDGIDVFRIDHIIVERVFKRAVATLGSVAGTGTPELSGLIDHVTCNPESGATVQCFNVSGAWTQSGQGSFNFPVLLGSNHAVYLEDNTCNYLITADTCMDAFEGASFVFRFNTITGTHMGVHGADSQYRGMHLVEAYRNSFTNTGTTDYMQGWRSGPNVSFDNTYTGNYTTPTFSLYRIGSLGDSYGAPTADACDGTSTWDTNTIPFGSVGQGYACYDQPGWYFTGTGPNPGAAVLSPAYLWRNTLGGSSVAAQFNVIDGGDTANYVIANRDFYQDAGASCSGASCSTGVGVGARSARPANCTTGVAWFATDQGSWNIAAGTPGGQGVLDKCTATNTWTNAYYTPYTYPHPLQAVSALPPVPRRLIPHVNLRHALYDPSLFEWQADGHIYLVSQ